MVRRNNKYLNPAWRGLNSIIIGGDNPRRQRRRRRINKKLSAKYKRKLSFIQRPGLHMIGGGTPFSKGSSEWFHSGECVFRDLMKSFASLRLRWINTLEQLCDQRDSFLTSFLVRRNFATNPWVHFKNPEPRARSSGSNQQFKCAIHWSHQYRGDSSEDTILIAL